MEAVETFEKKVFDNRLTSYNIAVKSCQEAEKEFNAEKITHEEYKAYVKTVQEKYFDLLRAAKVT